ncbi:helix-turn-helix domain-containing protein [Trichococcus sp.]|uniref:helix-turn-helix domain-containing protein n=1 Tax=Trichococcus sp. TaxID=1985464 RepID=UPI003C79C260
MNIDKINVGLRIKSIRQAKGFNMEEFGKLVNNTSKGAVNNWEKGVNLPNTERLSIIARLGEISVNELLYGSLNDFAYRTLELLKTKHSYSDSLILTIMDRIDELILKSLGFSKPYTKEMFYSFFIDYYSKLLHKTMDQLTHDDIRKPDFEDSLVSFVNNYGISFMDIKEKISKAIDGIQAVEINQFKNDNYKLLYNPSFKNELLEYLISEYSFDNLSEAGFTPYIKEILDEYLNKQVFNNKYLPYSVTNASNLSADLLSDFVVPKINEYFKDSNLDKNFHSDILETISEAKKKIYAINATYLEKE